MSRALFATATALVLLGALAPSPSSAWCRMTTSARLPSASEPCIFPDPEADPPEHYLEWLRPCSSVTLSVSAPSDDLTEAEVEGVLRRSIATWEAVSCGGVPFGIDIELMAERSTCDVPLYRDGGGGNANTIMFVRDWGAREYDPAAFAITTVWHRRSTGEILDVDMEMNERRGPFGICPDAGCVERTVDLENVITHELGHYLGIAHSEEIEATMYASAVAGETIKRDLHPDDIEGLCVTYPAGTPGGACDHTPRGGVDLDCEVRGCACSAGPRTPSPFGLFAFGLLALIARRARAGRRRS